MIDETHAPHACRRRQHRHTQGAPYTSTKRACRTDHSQARFDAFLHPPRLPRPADFSSTRPAPFSTSSPTSFLTSVAMSANVQRVPKLLIAVNGWVAAGSITQEQGQSLIGLTLAKNEEFMQLADEIGTTPDVRTQHNETHASRQKRRMEATTMVRVPLSSCACPRPDPLVVPLLWFSSSSRSCSRRRSHSPPPHLPQPPPPRRVLRRVARVVRL